MPRGAALLEMRPTPYGFSHVRLKLHRAANTNGSRVALSIDDMKAVVEVFGILRAWRDEGRR
ncbi:MAG: hypothetical protein HS104_11485 [Polyangiaceae bacterium]|nr:hypothetical protein [Polyangiaceae bacterium]